MQYNTQGLNDDVVIDRNGRYSFVKLTDLYTSTKTSEVALKLKLIVPMLQIISQPYEEIYRAKSQDMDNITVQIKRTNASRLIFTRKSRANSCSLKCINIYMDDNEFAEKRCRSIRLGKTHAFQFH